MKADLNNNNAFGFIYDQSGQPIITVCFGVELPLAKKQQIMNAVLNEFSTGILSMEDAVPMTWEQKKKEFKELAMQQETEHIIIWHMENILCLPKEEAKKRYDIGQDLKQLTGKTHESVIDSVYCADFEFPKEPIMKITGHAVFGEIDKSSKHNQYIAGVDPASSNPEVMIAEVMIADNSEKEKQELAEIEQMIIKSRQSGEGMDPEKLGRYLELRKKYEQ